VHEEFRKESIRKITEVEQKSYDLSKSSDGLSLKTDGLAVQEQAKMLNEISRDTIIREQQKNHNVPSWSLSGLHRVQRFGLGRRPEQYDNGNMAKRAKL